MFNIQVNVYKFNNNHKSYQILLDIGDVRTVIKHYSSCIIRKVPGGKVACIIMLRFPGTEEEYNM